MEKKYIYFLIFILVAFLFTTVIVYFSKEIEDFSIPEIQVPIPKYSFEKIIYNFWGFVTEKQGDTILVEGIVPEPGKTQTEEESLLTIKFKITPETKIVKLETVKFEKPEEETKQVFVTAEAIQLKDHLAIKADQIDKIKKEAIATDILILPPLPTLPTPPE